MVKHIHYFRFKSLCNRLIWRLLYSWSFKRYGRGVNLYFPEYIVGEKYISIGDEVYIGYRSSVIALKSNALPPAISIGNGTKIRRFFHLVCIEEVSIGSNVLIADKVFISDNIHGYKDVSAPVITQPLELISAVKIDDGACIGENVSILGAKIGKNSVVGANSVVLNDVPDYCVAVGSPAKVIKKYDFSLGKWVASER